MRNSQKIIAPILGIIGAGGFGKEIFPYLSKGIVTSEGDLLPSNVDIVFVESNPTKTLMWNVPILSLEVFRVLERKKYYCIAIGNSKIREKIQQDLINANCHLVSIKSGQSIVADDALVGDGAILTHFSLISENVKIGKHFHHNVLSYVGHDCIIGDYVTFAPGVKCNGHVRIDDHVFIGSGAVIKPGTEDNPRIIGKGAVIGMGAVVTKNVAEFSTVVGNPARSIL